MTAPITAAAYASTIATTTAKLGAMLPPALDAALAAARALRTSTAALEGSAHTVTAGIITALRTGADWRTDPAITAALFDRVAADCGIRVAGAAAELEDTRAAISAHADTLISAWNTALAPDVAALTEAAEKLPNTLHDLAAGDVARLSRSGLVNAWASARSAVERFTTARDGVAMVLMACGATRNRAHDALLIAETLPPGLADTPTPDAWTLARAGAALSCATPEQFRDRVRRHTDAAAQRTPGSAANPATAEAVLLS